MKTFIQRVRKLNVMSVPLSDSHIDSVCRGQELIPIDLKLEDFPLKPCLVIIFEFFCQFDVSTQN